MTENNQLKNNIENLLQAQTLGVLASEGDNGPYTSLVGFAYTPDLKNILIATSRNTHKFRNIDKTPQVSIMIDSRTNREADFKDAVALTVIGKHYSVESDQKDIYQSQYLKRFPFLNTFINDASVSIVAIKVERYIYVCRFQEVLELGMNPK